ncbi:unnamed protein product, partial [Cyprideis torosa]
VVDPGGDLEMIEAQLQKMGGSLEKILLTHAHIDHAGGTADLAERHGVPIEGPHKEDQFWIDALEDQSRMFSFPASRTFTPDRWLEDGDMVQVGNLSLQVLHCPGHTPGHVCFYSKDAQLAFVGDVLFKQSIGRSDFPRGDHAELIKSIKTKLFPLGKDVEFIPGHGPTSTFGHEIENNPFV